MEFKIEIKKSEEQLIIEAQDRVIKAYEKVEIDLRKEIKNKDELIAKLQELVDIQKEAIEFAQTPFFRKFGLFRF